MRLNFFEGGGKAVLSLEEIVKEDTEGWLRAKIIFDYKGFTANFPIYLMLNDIYAFLGELKELHRHLKGKATFSTIEGNVDIVLLGDGLGHIAINGLIRHGNDQSLVANFEIPSDQTFLAPLISQCDEIIRTAKSE
jgi:hypothetical protein